eukprot:191178_1
MEMIELTTYLIVSLFMSSNAQIIEINGVWNDDFQADPNGITGWKITRFYLNVEPTQYLDNPLVIGEASTVINSTYHGPFTGDPITVGRWNNLERQFQCKYESNIFVTYQFSYCNTESGNCINPNSGSDFTYIYPLDQYTEPTGRYDANGPYERCDDMDRSVGIDFDILETSNTWESNLPNDIDITCDKARKYFYDPPVTVYMGIREQQTPFTVILETKMTASDEYSFIFNIAIDCIKTPTISPTSDPTHDPTHDPTYDPTHQPTYDPTNVPTKYPTYYPTTNPTLNPTKHPTHYPTHDPTKDPTYDPTTDPTHDPTTYPTVDPSSDPTIQPSLSPTLAPTEAPSHSTPTTHPTFTNTVVYVRKNGCDYGYCNHSTTNETC